ncbi:DUF6346 domain-containing protein [Lentzea sp. JNUCC 0626]|uniref:DUF6346 domain-containing protein n=1 Tax=Lentzea sp. JNUCC 0626 TaxID=3367513 RepID=UPI0037493B74
MKAVRILHRIFAFLVIPVLGYLLGATIFNYFSDKVETEDLSDASHIIVATSCDRHGPVTLRGFGYVYECRATVTNKVNGNVVTTTARGFLRPDLIGKQVAGEGFNRGDLYPVRPYAGWGMVLLLPFGILWFYVYIAVAWRLLPERRKSRRKPVRYQRPENPTEPDRTVRVFAGRRRVWLFFVFLLGCVGVFVYNSSAFQDDAVATGVAIVSWAVVVLVIANVAWRLVRGPMIAISPEGLEWRGAQLSWAEIQEVQLTRRQALIIQPRNGEVVKISGFSTEEATRIHVAMGHFSQTTYAREDTSRT